MSNVDIARSVYDAFGEGNLKALKQMFAEDVISLASDELPLGGETRGRDALVGSCDHIPDYWTSFSLEPEEFIDAGTYVVVRGTQRASNENGGFEAHFLHLMKFEDGKLCRSEFFSDSAKVARLQGVRA